jgi:hypothetical protein
MIRSKGDYSILVILATVYVGVVYRFQTVPKYILIATSVFALSYVLWGIAHHIRARNFHVRIVLEYLLVALLGVAIVSTLLF